MSQHLAILFIFIYRTDRSDTNSQLHLQIIISSIIYRCFLSALQRQQFDAKLLHVSSPVVSLFPSMTEIWYISKSSLMLSIHFSWAFLFLSSILLHTRYTMKPVILRQLIPRPTSHSARYSAGVSFVVPHYLTVIGISIFSQCVVPGSEIHYQHLFM